MTTSKKTALKFTNAVAHLHGLICDCDEPITHSIKILLQQTQPELNNNQLKDLQQCLGTTPVAAVTEEDGLDFGEDLEKLFAADTEEDDTR